MVAFWEGLFLPKDANNLLTMLWTWQHGDIADNHLYRGDFSKALRAIRAKAYVMPSETDLYFPPADNELEVAEMPDAKCFDNSICLGPCRRRDSQSARRRLRRPKDR